MVNGKLFIILENHFTHGICVVSILASSLGQGFRRILGDEVSIFSPIYIHICLSSITKILKVITPIIPKNNNPYLSLPLTYAKLLRQGKRLIKHGDLTYIYCFPSELPIFLSNALIDYHFRSNEVKHIIRTIISSNDYKALCYTINKRQTVKIN